MLDILFWRLKASPVAWTSFKEDLKINFFELYFFLLQFLVIKILDPEPDTEPDQNPASEPDQNPAPEPDPDSLEMLDPDPYPCIRIQNTAINSWKNKL